MKEEGTWISYYKVLQFNLAGFFALFFITKCGMVILLQSVTDCYYKVHQVFQSVTDLWQSTSGIAKCKWLYCKVHQVLQSVIVITKSDITPVII